MLVEPLTLGAQKQSLAPVTCFTPNTPCSPLSSPLTKAFNTDPCFQGCFIHAVNMQKEAQPPPLRPSGPLNGMAD